MNLVSKTIEFHLKKMNKMSNFNNNENSELLLQVLSKVLERLISINESSIQSMNYSNNSMNNSMNHSMNHSNIQITKFDASYNPNITILSYLKRIIKYANCHESCFIIMLIYIDRLIERKSFIITNMNIHRLLITSVMLAIKFYEDDYYKNTFYARLGGISGLEINYLG